MTLREQIRKGLGESHTVELEDNLYLHVSEFVKGVREVYLSKEVVLDELSRLRFKDAIGLLNEAMKDIR